MAHKLLKPNLLSCFCLGIAWFVAKIAMYFLVPPPMPAIYSPASGATSRIRDAAMEPVTGEAVLRRNLFHVLKEHPKKNSGPGEDGEDELSAAEAALMREEMGKLPISKQGWTLLGTIANSIEPKDSRAIIVVDNKQNSYAPGGEIKGWKIALIERRTVVVEKNGRRERLIVGGQDIAAPKAAGAAPVRRSLDAAEIEQAMRDLPGLLRDAGFSAGQKEGVYGLNITFLNPDSFLTRLGLRQDDLLTSANGQTLTKMGDLAGLGNLARQDSLRLELMRNGRNMVIEYDITGKK